MGFFSRIGDTFYTLRFLRLLTTPWDKTGAFKAGLVDKDGKHLKSPKTSKEKSVYNYFHRLVFNLKRLLNKVPFGKKTVASYAAGLYLLKEECAISEETFARLLEKHFDIDLSTLVTEKYDNVPSGEYLLNEAGLLQCGEFFGAVGDIVKVCADDEILEFLNVPILRVTHMKSRQKLLITPHQIQL